MLCTFNETNSPISIAAGGVSSCVQDPLPDPAESSSHLHTLVYAHSNHLKPSGFFMYHQV
jgi:hypothetical protein